MKKFKIGFIIADKDELSSIDFKSLNIKTSESDYYGMKRISFDSAAAGGVETQTVILLCGIGLSCAAAAAAFLAAENSDVILNAGLSGSINGLCRNDVFVCEKIAEYDADLSALGYEIGKRPDLPVFFDCDKRLVNFFKEKINGAKSGVSASGNSFVASNEKKEFIKANFGASCCDMEASAAAMVCSRAGIPFVSIRKISDSADDDARSDYGSFNEKNTFSLFESIISALKEFPVSEF